MPLIPQQAIIYAAGPTYPVAYSRLEQQLDEYPEVRIISLAAAQLAGAAIQLIAVVETI